MNGTRFLAIVCAAGLGVFSFLPGYKANPVYIRSMASVTVLRGLQHGTLTGDAVVTPSGKSGISYVTLGAKTSTFSDRTGFLAREDTTLSYRLTTKSSCLELEPGCFEIRDERIRKTVSVKLTI
jgi:hypothetical protein